MTSIAEHGLLAQNYRINELGKALVLNRQYKQRCSSGAAASRKKKIKAQLVNSIVLRQEAMRTDPTLCQGDFFKILNKDIRRLEMWDKCENSERLKTELCLRISISLVRPGHYFADLKQLARRRILRNRAKSKIDSVIFDKYWEQKKMQKQLNLRQEQLRQEELKLRQEQLAIDQEQLALDQAVAKWGNDDETDDETDE